MAIDTASASGQTAFVDEFCRDYNVSALAINIDVRQDRVFLLTLDFDDFLELANSRECTVEGERRGFRSTYRCQLHEFDLVCEGRTVDHDQFAFFRWDD